MLFLVTAALAADPDATAPDAPPAQEATDSAELEERAATPPLVLYPYPVPVFGEDKGAQLADAHGSSDVAFETGGEPQSTDVPIAPAPQDQRPKEHMSIGSDGYPRDARGRLIGIEGFTRMIGDAATAKAHQDIRGRDKRRWAPVMVGGAVLASWGAGIAFLGGASGDEEAGRPSIILGSILGLAGLGGIVTGVGASFRSNDIHDDIKYWYTPDALQERVDLWNARVEQDRAKLEVQPFVGPGTAGLTGSF